MGSVGSSLFLADCVKFKGDLGDVLSDFAPCYGPGLRSKRMEEMMQELFRLQDLNQNGMLEEAELLKLNEKIAILHGADVAAAQRRFSQIFRSELDPEGRPITFSRFRRYMFRMLDSMDPDEPTQAMIMDQFIAEADLAIATFPKSLKVNAGFMRVPS
ncbi:unnamed protein product [Durusdinium trenchii]|uniref:Uncharacterized protein n=2 Tax=Durusdinium trenchii TaxID=1381693 RepID=A0ABP0HF03_9DINO